MFANEIGMERNLDVREREPPEPMELILAELYDLPEQDWLRVRHWREPFPLYGMLRDMGFKWHSRWVADEVVILIWHIDNHDFDRDRVSLC